MRFLLAIGFGLLLCACPPDSGSGGAKKSTEPVKICTSAGETCVFQEGKLGLCVESNVDPKVKGAGPSAPFVCQSQH